MKKIGGWGNFSILCLIIIILAYGYFKKRTRIDNANYTKGISDGVHKEVRGTLYLHYHFLIDGKYFKGHIARALVGVVNNKVQLENYLSFQFRHEHLWKLS